MVFTLDSVKTRHCYSPSHSRIRCGDFPECLLCAKSCVGHSQIGRKRGGAVYVLKEVTAWYERRDAYPWKVELPQADRRLVTVALPDRDAYLSATSLEDVFTKFMDATKRALFSMLTELFEM